jgi:hypothetical protein
MNNKTASLMFPKFDGPCDPYISNFLSSVPRRFSDAVNKMTSPSFCRDATEDLVINNRIKLQDLINKFHSEADTMTREVREKISLLGDNKTQILVSTHQPNLFAYSGVFKKIILLHALKTKVRNLDPRRKLINLFLIVDHDSMDEIWVRVAQLPSIRNSVGILDLRVPVTALNKKQMICEMPLPRRQILDHWKSQIRRWLRDSLSSPTEGHHKSVFIRNFKEFWDQVELSYYWAKSYSDLNSFLMSQLVNKVWGYDTLFVRLSEIPSVFEDGFKYLISNFESYTKALIKIENIFNQQGVHTNVSSSVYEYAPVWARCKCGSKAALKIKKNSVKQVLLTGICLSCKKSANIILGRSRNELDIPQEILKDFFPRAIPIILLLSRDLGVSCYASGIGGLDYMIHAATTCNELSIKMPLTIFWPSKDIYQGLGQRGALKVISATDPSQVISHIEVLKQRQAEYWNKIKPLLEGRKQLIKAQKPLEKFLSDLFKLKEDQRKLRRMTKISEKVHSAIRLSPCFIDYAINFGIRNVETQWRENLVRNNNLALPVALKINGSGQVSDNYCTAKRDEIKFS